MRSWRRTRGQCRGTGLTVETIGDWCTLIHADCHAAIDELRAMTPDAMVTDPPYGLGLPGTAGYEREPITSVQERRGAAPIVGDRDRSVDIRPLMQVAPQSVVWGADHLRAQLPSGGRFIAWDKLDGMAPWDSFSDVEFAWHSRAGKATIIRWMWKGLACSKVGEDNGFRHHPMQKPLHVMQESIAACRLEPGSLVCDPFMGAGSTAIAAFGLGMRFVGVEIERRWFDCAVERIRERCAAPLFD